MPYDSRILGRSLMRARLRKGMSGNELARKAGGMSEGTIRAIESGMTRAPRLDTMHKLADALEVPLWEVLGEDMAWRREYEQVRKLLETILAREEGEFRRIRGVLSSLPPPPKAD